MSQAWARIEGWLHECSPATIGLLAGPAEPDLIRAAEEACGVTFPAELVESLRCHDGLAEWGSLLPEADPLGVTEIAERYEIRMDVAADVDGFAVHEPNTEPWWHELWIPFAASGGDLQVIDLRPGSGRGRLGFAPNSDAGDFSTAWPSLGAYLTAVADALERGGTVGLWHPGHAADGTLRWELAGQT
ncbi:hypothetical protein GCM10023107_76890 [Actinoplanes octamycinicus]